MMSEKRIPVTIAATEARNKFGEMLRRTHLEAQHFIIRRNGAPVAAVIPFQDYQRLVTSAAAANSPRCIRPQAHCEHFYLERFMRFQLASLTRIRPTNQDASY